MSREGHRISSNYCK